MIEQNIPIDFWQTLTVISTLSAIGVIVFSTFYFLDIENEQSNWRIVADL